MDIEIVRPVLNDPREVRDTDRSASRVQAPGWRQMCACTHEQVDSVLSCVGEISGGVGERESEASSMW
jgi:hypothetical protein